MVFLLYRYSPCAPHWEWKNTRRLVDFERILAVRYIPMISKKRRNGEHSGTPVSTITNPEENEVQISPVREYATFFALGLARN
jgi:hypothetical protein